MGPFARQFRRIAGLSRNAKLFLLTVSIVALGSGIFMLLLNLFILARGNDQAFLGLLMSTMSLTALSFGLPMGILVDRLGRKQAMVLGAILSIPGTLLLVLSPKDWPLMLAAALYGAGNALYMAAGPAFMAENASEDERPTLFSLHSGLSLLMGFLGSALGGSLPTLFSYLLRVHPESVTAYRATLLSAEGIMVFALIPLLMIQERPAARTDQSVKTFSLQDLPFRRDVMALLIPELIIALGAGLLIPYLNIFFKQRFRISDSFLGLIFAVAQLLMGAATLLAPVLAERWGKIRTVVFTQLASLPFLLMLGFVPILSVAIGAFWLRAILMNMAGPLYTAFAMERVRDEERGTVGAMIGVAYSIGQSIGPGISGFIQRSFGFSPLFLTTGATYLFAALLTFALFGRTERLSQELG
ncbi:MAG: MFS transporter [Anaerolineae bacterium]|nr:MFS transporter [Anaerolineae bacterium]MDW8102783.1 MFS transporter [Anaerolineae bacterium]